MSRDKTARVGDISHKECTVFISCLAEVRVVPIARIRRCTADNETRFEDACLRCKALIVDQLRLRVKCVREGLEVDR